MIVSEVPLLFHEFLICRRIMNQSLLRRQEGDCPGAEVQEIPTDLGSKFIFMPSPFEEWWKGHNIVLTLSVRPCPSASKMALAICV